VRIPPLLFDVILEVRPERLTEFCDRRDVALRRRVTNSNALPPVRTRLSHSASPAEKWHRGPADWKALRSADQAELDGPRQVPVCA
jgi:hypothetical protein